MYAMKKLKDRGTLYNKLYYKTLGEKPELFKSTVKETGCRGHNLIHRKVYSPVPFIQFFFYSILNTEEKLIITLSTEAITPMNSAGFILSKI